MAGSAASTGCNAVAAAPPSTIFSPTARASTSPAMPQALAPYRARWRALPSSKERCPRHVPGAALRSSSSPPTPRRARVRAEPGGTSLCLRCRAGPRSVSPARPTTWREPDDGSSVDPSLGPDSRVMVTATISLELDVHLAFEPRFEGPPRHRSVKKRYAQQQIDRTNRPKPLRLQVRVWADSLLEAHRQVYEKLNATTASWRASYEGQAGAKVGNPP